MKRGLDGPTKFFSVILKEKIRGWCLIGLMDRAGGLRVD